MLVTKVVFEQRIHFICLFMIAIIFSGCGGRASQMAQLKRKMGAANLPSNNGERKPNNVANDNVANDNVANENGTSPDTTPSPKQQGSKSSGITVAKNDASNALNMNNAERQNAKSADENSDFVQFRRAMVKKLNERRGTLNQYQRLNSVARAFGEYVRDKRSYPPAKIGGKAHLSWRVSLLPYLGYPELYKMFDIESRYNSPLNNRLIDLMPPEYETTSQKGKTTLLAPIGTFTAYWSPNRPMMVSRLEDGISDTVGIVDVDEASAVTWTRPVDLNLKPGKEVFQSLGGKYNDHFIVFFGDGRMEKVSIRTSFKYFIAMLSYDRGDRYPANLLLPVEESDFASPENQIVDASRTPGPTGNPKDSKVNPPAQSVPNIASTSSNSQPKNQYSVRLKQLETEALLNGDQATAMELNFARILIEDDSVAFKNFKWCKALQRPAMSLRWQIGISLANTGTKTDPIKRTVARQITVQRPGTKTLEKKTGQIGLDSAIVLRKLVDEGLMGKIIQEHALIVEAENQAPRRGSDRDVDSRSKAGTSKSNDEELFDSRKQPELHYSGIEVAIGQSRSYHLQVARERGIDVLLLLEIELRRIRQKTMNTTTLYVIDVQRGKELMKSAALSNLKIEQDRENALKEDAVFTAMKKFDQYCRDNIALSSLPQNISRENVFKRLGTLIAKKDQDVLKLLVEGRLYFEKGLISNDDYKKYCQAIFKDTEAGMAIAIGAPKYRFDAIRPLLPRKLDLKFN